MFSLLKKTGVLWGWRLLLNKKKASKEHHVNYYLNNDWRFSVLHYYVNKETTLLCSLLLPSHSQIHTNILYNTQSEKLGLTYKCAPESVCLQINIWVYISKHGPSVLLIAQCHFLCDFLQNIHHCCTMYVLVVWSKVHNTELYIMQSIYIRWYPTKVPWMLDKCKMQLI